MILLWGRPEEAPLAEARAALGRAGAEVAMFDERRALNATVRLSAESAEAGELRVDGRRIELETVSAAYFRPYGADSSLDRVELSRREAVARRVGGVSASLWAWADITRAFVLNRPTLMASNASKPLQAQMLSACGFDTPATLATTDAGLARAFIATHRDVIYKSISGTRSIVARLDRAKAARLDALLCCPVQFQEYVPGVDVRVHVVGDAMFACELRSDADDYRYSGRSGQTTDVTPTDLPPDIAALCRRASAALGLPLCGIESAPNPGRALGCLRGEPLTRVHLFCLRFRRADRQCHCCSSDARCILLRDAVPSPHDGSPAASTTITVPLMHPSLRLLSLLSFSHRKPPELC